MTALFEASLWATFYFLGGLLLPGFAIRCGCAAKFGPQASTFRWVMESLALGSLWATVQFLVLRGVVSDTGWQVSKAGVLAWKHGSDGLVVLAAFGSSRVARDAARSALARGLRSLSRWDNLLAMVLATATAWVAVVQFPYAADNAALYWIAGALTDPHFSIESAQGSPAYLAWLYWPSLQAWPDLPASTIGAGSKLVLHVLCLFGLQRLLRLWPGLGPTWLASAYFLFSFVSLFGLYGLLETAKETVFAVIFFFAAIAASAEEDSVGDPGRNLAPALFSLAFGFGAITIPYAAVYLVLHALLGVRLGSLARWWRDIALWGFLPLTFSFSSMLHLPLAACTVAMAMVVVGLHWLQNPIDRFYEGWTKWLLPRRRRLSVMLFVVAAVTVWSLLPVRYEAKPLAPLDGESTFVSLFLWCRFNGVLPGFVGFLALGGMAVVAFTQRVPESRRAALIALAAFPWVTLIPVLAIARLQITDLPVHPQHWWDLAKDIPNWCWGVMVMFFAFILVVEVAQRTAQWAGKSRSLHRIPQKWLVSAGLAAVVLVYAGYLIDSGRLTYALRFEQGAFLNERGGHRDPHVAHFMDAILTDQARDSSGRAVRRLYRDPSARCASVAFELNGCGLKQKHDLRPLVDPETAERLVCELPCYVISSREQMERWMKGAEEGTVTDERVVAGPSDSLFLVRFEPGQSSAMNLLPDPAFHDIQRRTLRGNLTGSLRVNWEDFAATELREKDGDPYLWGSRGGTIWIELPATLPDESTLELKVNFFGETPGTLRVTSPVMDEERLFSKPDREGSVKLIQPASESLLSLYGSRWVPFKFAYEGEMREVEGADYPKSYRIESMAVWGRSIIR